MKTLEQIKEEVSSEFFNPKRTWSENSKFSDEDEICVLESSGAIDEVAKRYASQYQERINELEANLSKTINVLEDSVQQVIHLKRRLGEPPHKGHSQQFLLDVTDLIKLLNKKYHENTTNNHITLLAELRKE